MSRVGKQPISLPSGVSVDVEGGVASVKGPKGDLRVTMPRGVRIAIEDGTVTVNRLTNSKGDRAAHGTAQRLLANAVAGVVTPFKVTLEIVGVGYTSNVRGKALALKVGYANEISVPIPDGVTVTTPSATQIVVEGADRQKVGAFAARTRKVRPPEPYNGKGIRYLNERIQKKAGKSFASGG